jgi:hypothetical protein
MRPVFWRSIRAMRTPARTASIAALILILGVPARAEVVRFVVEQRQTFASTGIAYEKLTGHFYGQIDPRHKLNAIITDIELAPRNDRGMVEYSATFVILKPVDMDKSTGVVVYQVPNRGRQTVEGGGVYADFRAAGHTLVASGWQADIAPGPGVESMVTPIAKNPDGSSITGPVMARFLDMPAGTTTLPIVRGRVTGTATPASFDTTHATLTRRTTEDGSRVAVAPSDWAFADCTQTPFPGQPDPIKVCLKGGFDPAFLYELTYIAKDPPVHGIGFAATRDLIAFLRKDSATNPLGGTVRHAVAQGTSQSGNYLRSFVSLGFNQDERGQRVFDGMNAHIAARQLSMNIRFAAPSGAAEMFEPGSEGTLWWEDYTDTARGRSSSSLLARCRAAGVCPKIVETFGSAEFYSLRMSPDLVGTSADRDIPLPANVRRYYIAGVRHGGGPGGFSPNGTPDSCCMLAANPNSAAEAHRALMIALVDWVVRDAPPPPSQYPRLDRGDLVPPTQAATGFPVIPGQPLPDGVIVPFYDYNFGPGFRNADESGIVTLQPPIVRQTLPMLVPRVDADGNETAGVRSVLLQAPLGTYTGWNPIGRGFLKGHIQSLGGGFIPFARTKAERVAAGDPRPSLEERYGSHAEYVAKVRAAAKRLVDERFLLPDDADRLVREAENSNVLR